MAYRGDIRLGDTIDLKFTTVDTAGVPITLAGTPVVSAYPNNSTTELTAGITLTVDFDARTGLHNVRVVATSGNGYATATNYDLVITTGTVGGSSVVGYVIGSFSIEARSAVMPTTAARTLDVAATGEAGMDLSNVNGTLDATEVAVDTCNKIADHVLRRTYANARGSSFGDTLNFRSLLGAVGKLVNKWSISGTTLTVFQEDDATSTAPGGTQTVTGTPGADPITAIDTT